MKSQKPNPILEQATKRQLDYIEILFNDCEYDTRHKRLQFLRLELKRNNINANDEISKSEASLIINRLKDIKDQLKLW